MPDHPRLDSLVLIATDPDLPADMSRNADLRLHLLSQHGMAAALDIRHQDAADRHYRLHTGADTTHHGHSIDVLMWSRTLAAETLARRAEARTAATQDPAAALREALTIIGGISAYGLHGAIQRRDALDAVRTAAARHGIIL